jgi:superfamily II DNA or RNA helicase
MKPVSMNMNFGAPGGNDDTAFPVYRESTSKIYIPRFYGIHRYGLPDKSELQEGEDISIEFTKTLRDYQTNIINTYETYCDTPICCGSSHNANGGILEVPCGRGKTVMALKIISDLHKKTLIIVHKEFLMNQWIERIEEFLPGTKIGKIQGQTFDIEGKDIVIGMLQSLYDKDYGKDAFSSFGLTVIDEVHRIGSEQFSKTLFKAVTPYMLGISATVDRKDGLTKVLYMFIGDKIYSETREDDDPVCVRAIQYHTNDTEFNDVEYDFRGNPKYSTMITKLCAYEPRTIFISKVVKDLISEDVSKQIMILCHNRSLLTSLFEKISQGGFASVGYYVGGMKQKDLQETETKQIVLATYAMAAEALDIKTLSTLIMVTPKTDITQSVGRILRVKHENPVIVDIIDQHEPFQKQWLQRKRFYKKCNYLIKQATNIKYENMSLDWKQDNDVWKTVYDPKKPTKKSKSKKNEKDDDDDESKKCLIDVSLFDFGD